MLLCHTALRGGICNSEAFRAFCLPDCTTPDMSGICWWKSCHVLVHACRGILSTVGNPSRLGMPCTSSRLMWIWTCSSRSALLASGLPAFRWIKACLCRCHLAQIYCHYVQIAMRGNLTLASIGRRCTSPIHRRFRYCAMQPTMHIQNAVRTRISHARLACHSVNMSM